MANIWTACGLQNMQLCELQRYDKFCTLFSFGSAFLPSAFLAQLPTLQPQGPFLEWCSAEDYHADFLFCFPPHFVYVLQGRDLVMFDGSLHHILLSMHGMLLHINLCSYTGIYCLSLVPWDTYKSPLLASLFGYIRG